MKVQIFYIATGGYRNYFEYFKRSLKYFMPEDEKYVTIFSDGLDEYNSFSDEYIKRIDVKHIYDLIYPSVNLNKPLFVNSEINRECECAFLFDADTYFIERPDYDWEEFRNKIREGKIFLTQHPFYSMADGSTFYGSEKKNVIENLFSYNVTEKDPRRASFISAERYQYVNSSFWGGRIDELIKFNDKIIELSREDLSKYPIGYHIPKYIDENYVNKILYEVSNGNMEYGNFDFSFEKYSAIYNVDNDEYPTCFMYQKNMGDFKFLRK